MNKIKNYIKKIVSFPVFWLLALIFIAATGPSVGINAGKLLSDFNGNSLNITNLNSLQVSGNGQGSWIALYDNSSTRIAGFTNSQFYSYQYLGTQTNLIGTTPTIDWASATKMYQTLSGGTTYTFVNNVDTLKIKVYITDTAGNFTVTWPVTVKWPNNITPIQTVGAHTDVYELEQVNGIIFGSVKTNY